MAVSNAGSHALPLGSRFQVAFCLVRIPWLGVSLNSQISVIVLKVVSDVSSPAGSLSPPPKAYEANGDQANWADEEMDIGVTDDSVSGLKYPTRVIA